MFNVEVAEHSTLDVLRVIDELYKMYKNGMDV